MEDLRKELKNEIEETKTEVLAEVEEVKLGFNKYRIDISFIDLIPFFTDIIIIQQLIKIINRKIFIVFFQD